MADIAYHVLMLVTVSWLVYWLFKPELRKLAYPHMCPRCWVRPRSMPGAPCRACIYEETRP